MKWTLWTTAMTIVIAGCAPRSAVDDPLVIGEHVQASPHTDAISLAWLEGSWRLVKPDGNFIEETWRSSPAPGVAMVGVNWTCCNEDGIGAFEVLAIHRADDGSLEFHARPGGRTPATVFRERKTEHQSRWIFENPNHDFPTEIHYRRTSDDRLEATIWGPVDGRQMIMGGLWLFERTTGAS
ncbi:MAG: DUF6265 family protein [Planctomycetota bacterium]